MTIPNATAGVVDRPGEGTLSVADTVKILIGVFESRQYLDRVCLAGQGHLNGKEVLLRLAVFHTFSVGSGRRGADALHMAARDRSLENLLHLHEALRGCADGPVEVVDEEDDPLLDRLAQGVLELLEPCKSLLTGGKRREVERKKRFFGQACGGGALGDLPGQGTDDTRLAVPRLAH